MIEGGFFDLGTGVPPPKKGGKKLGGCLGCGLYKTCNSPKMKPEGEGLKKILIVGETPGQTEDMDGLHFVGGSGKLLERTLESLGIDMREDCILTNALQCRPPENRGPTEQEIAECRPRLLKTISEVKPKLIIVLGTIGVKGLLHHRIAGRLSGIKMAAFFGKHIPDRELGAWVSPNFNPPYLQKRKDLTINRVFKENLKIALLNLENPVLQLGIETLTTQKVHRATKWVKSALESNTVAFDYETTGIKPHRKGHKIVSASIAFISKEGDPWEPKVYAFPFFEDEEFRDAWKELMTNPKIGKIAHKLDFEAMWTNEKLGYWPVNWEWDTCIGAHCINSKQDTKLKFHAFTEFGVIGYDDSVDKFLTTVKVGEETKNKNSFNQIDKAPFKDLLTYNGYDSLYTLLLYEKQLKEFDPFTLKGIKFFIKGLEALAHVQQKGMKIDLDMLETYEKRITKKIDRYYEQLIKFKEYKRWTGKKEINLNSNKQLENLLYITLGYTIPEGCEDNPTTEKALEKIDTEFTRLLLPYRKAKKIRDTYMSQFKRERIGSIIHPFFNLHIAKTFRSTSDSPNFQNLPKRSANANLVRDLVIPRKGNKLIEYDYKGVEVCISACVHKDPQMIKYIRDPTTDMHRDMAQEILLKSPGTVTKEERQIIKNTFVFPAFYGSTCRPEEGKTVGNITRNIWEDIPKETISHLRTNGIKNIKKFQAHLKEVEWKFWNERFEVYNDWKREMYEEYEKKGYVELYTGFRCYAPLQYTEATNYPIQGTAFHILLETLINGHKKINEISGRSSIIGQVHDSLIVDCHPEDEEEIDAIVYLEGVKKPMKKYDWIIVPLNIEKESSEVNGSWATMKDCGILK